MRHFLTGFIRNRDGATAIEYAYIAAFIALMIVGVLVLMGPEIRSIFSDVRTDFQNRNTP